MYDLNAFRDRIAALYRRTSPYDDGRRPNQKDLADAIGLNRSELSSRLNGLKNARLSARDVKAIIQTLADWGAITTQGEAYELLALVECPNFTAAEWQAPPLVDLAPSPAPLPSPPSTQPSVLSPRPSVLPRPLTSFIGRDGERAEVTRLISQRRLVTLFGTGGVGKTRLAIEVASQLEGRFRDGIYFVELASLPDATLVPAAIGRALGIEEQGSQPLAIQLRRYLQPREVLLALDNCEQLVPPLAILVQELLSACPRLHILATSRELLHIQGEVSHRVLPLPLPPREAPLTPASLKQYEAVQLFVERATTIQPDFALSNANVAAIHAICQQLDGIPLAIELAVARLNVLSVTQIMAQLADRFRLLADHASGVAVRHQTLRALIDWSYDLLPANEQALFRRLAVFSGGFSITAVADTLGVAPLDILDPLTELLNKSMIYPLTEGESEPRFAMLETIREYALLKLEESGEAEVWQRKHAEYYLAFAQAAAPQLTGGQQAEWLGRLEREYDNLRACFSWSLATPANANIALHLGADLWRFWQARGPISEGRQWLERALQLSDQSDISGRAPALDGVGCLAYLQGDFPAAYQSLESCLLLQRELGNQRGIASALNHLAGVVMQLSDFRRARDLYEESLTINRALDDRWGVRTCLNNLGIIAESEGDFRRAQELYEQSLALAKELGSQTAIASTLANLGDMAHSLGQYPAARQFLESSLSMVRELGDKWNIAYAQLKLGYVAVALGDYDMARSWFKQSFILQDQMADRLGIVGILEGLAALATAEGEAARAARLWGASEVIREEIQAPIFPTNRPLYDDYVAAARATLGNVAFDRAWQAGRMMDQQSAVAYALSDKSTPPSH